MTVIPSVLSKAFLVSKLGSVCFKLGRFSSIMPRLKSHISLCDLLSLLLHDIIDAPSSIPYDTISLH